jgi:hypothetical protein
VGGNQEASIFHMKITNKQPAYATQALLRGRGWGRLNYLYLFMLFGAMWAAQSCRKEPNLYENRIYVEGKVVEKGKIPNPAVGVKVILYEVKSDQLLGPVSFVPIGNATTDQNGFYTIDQPGVLNRQYHLAAEGDPERYWNREDEPITGDLPSTGRKNVTNLVIQPYGFIKVHAKNTSPVDEKDQIVIGGAWAHSISDEVFLFGTQIDETFVRRVFANDTTKVSYRIQKGNNAYVYGKQVKFLTSKDTLKININY